MNKIDTKALREKILDLAMRGKLVPQDPNDEPASVLLENIKKEKEQLMKDKVIKKQKPLPPIEKDEEPFEIPDSWEWVRLGEICKKISDGTHNPPKNTHYGIPLLSAKNINNHIDFKSIDRFMSEDDFIKENKRTQLEKNDILLTIVGSIGRTAIINITEKFMIQRSVAVIKSMIHTKFLYFVFQTPYLQKWMQTQATGTAQKGVYLRTINVAEIPLPPLSEQQRIVSKIEELFAELDKIDKAQEKYDSAANKLREKVLDTAMRGKLVPQDPNDEPASELLKRIEKEKQKLIEQKVAPKNKNYDSISTNKYPFSIPKNWCFTYFGNIANTTKFKSIKPNDIKPNCWILGMGDVEKETGKIINIKHLSDDLKIKSNKYLFYKDDILYGKLNPYLKKVLVAPSNGVCTTEFIPINLYGFCSPILYSLILKSSYVSALVDEASYGATLPRVKPDFISRLIVPLLPEQEQKRIVKQIELIFKELE